MRVSLQKLTKTFGAVVAVNELDLEIKSGEFVALLGPSGCGKTTTLLMVAGIYRPTAGAIVFGERRVREAAGLVHVDKLLERRPAQLSGGQQQRVALARALVKRPDILLLDEPLSNLDARLRHEMRGEIKRLQKEVGITSIFVTHDQLEALTMADRVALMNDGKLQAYATPIELYAQPANRFVAEFIGTPPMNFFDVELAARNGSTIARAEGIEIALASAPRVEAGRQATVGVRPEHVTIVAPGEGNARGELFVLEPMGREQIVDVQVGDRRLQAIAPPGFSGRIGDQVGLRLAPERLHLFDPTSGERLS